MTKLKKIVEKIKRYPDYIRVECSHLLDSIWVKKDKTELRIVFARGQILDFRPVKKGEENENPFIE